MPSFLDRPLFRLALVGVLAASFALAGCGRKGGLDPPPGASLEGATPAAQDRTLTSPIGVAPIGGTAADDNAGVDSHGRPQAPKGPNKRIFLDGLLN